MVAVSLFVIPALGQGPITADVGTLRLQMNSGGDKFVFDPDAAGPDVTQSLSASNCKLSSVESLVDLGAKALPGTPANKLPYPGLKDHRIGVGQTGEGNGEPCARVNQSLSQTLTLSLTGTLDGMAIDYAEIDLGFKFNGDAILELSRGGLVVDTVTVPCNGQSDCGPDSGGNDNLRVKLDSRATPVAGAIEIAGPFDTVAIRSGTVGGVVSLEGGLGGTGDSVFHLVETFDGEIDCGETATLSGDDATFAITRGNDTDGNCKGPVDGLLFDFESGLEGERLFVDFVTEPVGGTAFAQFLEVITWEYDSPPDVDGGDSQQRTLSYDDNGPIDPPGERVMPWCLTDPRPLSTTSPLAMPAGHTSCLIESTSHVTLLGDFVKVDIVYNIGDGKRWN
jgi:hypothetical protein